MHNLIGACFRFIIDSDVTNFKHQSFTVEKVPHFFLPLWRGRGGGMRFVLFGSLILVHE
jgi:hypothetical protein